MRKWSVRRVPGRGFGIFDTALIDTLSANRRTDMGWVTDEFQRARRRRFIRALEAAKAELASIPAEHRFRLAREFDEAADMARRHVEYQRPS